MITAQIYDQEGVLQSFTMKGTRSNQKFAEWLRVHDRYTPRLTEDEEQETSR